MPSQNFFAGVDLGGTKINITLLGEDGTFRISEMMESPSLVGAGTSGDAEADGNGTKAGGEDQRDRHEQRRDPWVSIRQDPQAPTE